MIIIIKLPKGCNFFHEWAWFQSAIHPRKGLWQKATDIARSAKAMLVAPTAPTAPETAPEAIGVTNTEGRAATSNNRWKVGNFLLLVRFLESFLDTFHIIESFLGVWEMFAKFIKNMRMMCVYIYVYTMAFKESCVRWSLLAVECVFPSKSTVHSLY